MAKFCTNCGSPLEDNQAKCEYCGKEFTVETAQATQTQETISQAAPQAQQQPKAAGSKSKMCAGLLGIFLGGLGVHNFYLGYTGKAVAQLLISLLSCGFLSGISAIWGLIEGIMILTGSIAVDGNGNPLAD